jgi:uracil-DNA glycosylase family 4
MAKHVGIPMEWMPESLPPLPQNPAVVVLGQNPGKEENDKGRNFIHRIGKWGASAGATLRDSYLAGISLYERACIYLVNGARCGPDSVSTTGPYNTCLPLHLPSDLSLITTNHAPKELVILVVSAPALRALFLEATGTPMKQGDYWSKQGTRIKIPNVSPDPAVFSTFHPAYVGRFPALIFSVEKHLEKLSDFLEGKKIKPDPISIDPITEPPDA